MTEDQWLTNSQVEDMLKYLGVAASARKLRLFAVACARRVLPRAADYYMTHAINVAEQFADGLAKKWHLAAARKALQSSHAERSKRWSPLYSDHIRSVPAWHAARDQIVQGAKDCAGCSAWSTTRKIRYGTVTMTIPDKELKEQCSLLRDIFGNPFRPVTLDPRWLSSNVLDLARTIYEQRVFERMPILADALMDAGCDSEEMLNHCRGEVLHVRGCWVVDLLLQKG
jgi:hypothetical protein